MNDLRNKDVEPLLLDLFEDNLLNKDDFNKSVEKAILDAGDEVTYSSDGYVLLRASEGAKVVIASSMIHLLKPSKIVIDTQPSLSDKICDLFSNIELNEYNIHDELLEREEKVRQSQHWKKSNQKHPAFRR